MPKKTWYTGDADGEYFGRGQFDYALIAEKSSRILYRVKCDANKRLIMKSIVHFGLFPNQINSAKKRN